MQGHESPVVIFDLVIDHLVPWLCSAGPRQVWLPLPVGTTLRTGSKPSCSSNLETMFHSLPI